jgi:hypothetical protein
METYVGLMGAAVGSSMEVIVGSMGALGSMGATGLMRALGLMGARGLREHDGNCLIVVGQQLRLNGSWA